MDANEPDKWDRASIYKQWLGLNYRANRIDAEFLSQYELNVALTKRVEALEAERDEARAKIGELQGRVDRMAAWAKEVDERKNGVAK